MGTTLTGTTPQDTYDSLIKVTDNGPISGTLKALSDGLGNDSTLSLSTTAASIAGTLAVSGNATFDTNTLFVDAAANEVGIGTITPARQLNVSGTGITGTQVQINGTQDSAGIKLIPLTGDNYEIQSTTASKFLIYNRTDEAARLVIDGTGNVGIGTSDPATRLDVSSAGFEVAAFRSTFGQMAISFANSGTTFAQLGSGLSVTATSGAGDLGLGTNGGVSTSIVFATGASYLERMRITSTGNVGIGTTAPTGRLTVFGEVDILADPAGAGYGSRIGMPFNVSTYDLAFYTRSNTATFTERVRILSGGGITFNGDTAAANALDDYEEGTWTMGVSFGNASVGITYAINTGTYTKIGRQVTVNGYITLASKGSSTGAARITGLPFTIANTTPNYASPSFYFDKITFANQFQGYGNVNTTTVVLAETTVLGATTNITDVDFSNNSEIMLNFTYFV
jgi:hypothetical protein